jgi:hypothetical protein
LAVVEAAALAGHLHWGQAVVLVEAEMVALELTQQTMEAQGLQGKDQMGEWEEITMFLAIPLTLEVAAAGSPL